MTEVLLLYSGLGSVERQDVLLLQLEHTKCVESRCFLCLFHYLGLGFYAQTPKHQGRGLKLYLSFARAFAIFGALTL